MLIFELMLLVIFHTISFLIFVCLFQSSISDIQIFIFIKNKKEQKTAENIHYGNFLLWKSTTSFWIIKHKS